MPEWSKESVSVTLTGAEWFALMVKISGDKRGLSKIGVDKLKSATEKMTRQILDSACPPSPTDII